ncbi:MAG TPA: hypothetical protein PLT65_00665 [Bacilli bacterium]|nr:hypothetical protein [Bacilli bacterium]
MKNNYHYQVLSKMLPIEKKIELSENNIDITDKHWIVESIFLDNTIKPEQVIKEQIEENGMRIITFDDESHSVILYDQKYLPDIENYGECEEEVWITFPIEAEYCKFKGELLKNRYFKNYIDINNNYEVDMS